MTIAADFAAYGMATKKITATGTSTLITGTAGLAAEAIPRHCTHLALIPADAGVYFAFGTASANTAPIPMGGIIINTPAEPAQDVIQLYAAADTVVQVIFGGVNGRVLLGTSLSTGDISIGNVGLLNAAEAEINPATEDSLAAAAADLNELTAAPVAKVPISIVKALAATPVPLALAAAETYVTSFTVEAARANAVNTGSVFVGLIADLVSGTKNYFTLTPGDPFTYTCRAGTKVNLALFGVDGETTTDGVIGIYEPV